MGPDEARGPYAALTGHLERNAQLQDAVRVAARFPGVNPMDVLRSDDAEWATWLAMAHVRDAHLAAYDNE